MTKEQLKRRAEQIWDYSRNRSARREIVELAEEYANAKVRETLDRISLLGFSSEEDRRLLERELAKIRKELL